MPEAKEAQGKEALKFTKQQIVGSEKFSGSLDLLTATLEEEKTYTIAEVEAIVNKFMKGKVN